MTLYNLTNLSVNSTDVLGFTQNVNDTLMFGWLGTFFLVGLFVVLLTSLLYATNNVKGSLIASTFALSLGSILFRMVDLVPDVVIYVSFVVFGLVTAFSWKN